MSVPIGEWEVDRFRIRIQQGRKGADDRLITVATPDGEYVPMSFAAMAAITALWYQNEDRLYPPEHGGRGGQYVLDLLTVCCVESLRSACKLFKLRAPSIREIDRAA